MTPDAETTEPDYQLGQGQTNASGVDLGDNAEFIPWDVEVSTTIKRNAIDIYTSREAGVREPTNNSVATLLEAVENGCLESIYDALLNIELYETLVDEVLLEDDDYHGPTEELELLIEDNGMGMPKATVEKVLAVLGRTLTRDSGDRSGMFGIGFLAVFLLPGWDNAFELHTHARDSEDGPISAVINNNGITIDNDGVLDGGFADDEYGTRLRFILSEEVSKDDIRSYVRKYTEYARVPAEYTEYNDDGIETFHRDYGMKSLEDDYDPGVPIITYEDEFIRAVLSPDADGQTINLDGPIKRGYTKTGDLPWSFDVRLKNENKPIVRSDDPDRIGLFYTGTGDYESMDADRKEKYTDELHHNEIAMVGIAGTRDSLKRDRDFWREYVIANLETEYENEIKRVLTNLDTPSDILALSDEDLTLLKQAVSDQISDFTSGFHNDKTKDDYTPEQLRSDIIGQYDITLSEDLATLLVALKQDVTVLSEDYGVDSQPDAGYFPSGCGEKEAWSVAETADGTVFMGVSINQKKADVAWSDNSDNLVVKLDSSDAYDVFQSAFGWEKLASITNKTIDQYDIPDDLRSEFEEEVGTTQSTNIHDTELTLNYRVEKREKYRNYVWKLKRESVTARRLREGMNGYYRYDDDRPKYGPTYSSRCSPRLIILFPDKGEKNISDYYWLASTDLALARADSDLREYFEFADGIVTIDEYLTRVQTESFSTSTGGMTLGDNPDACIFHLLSEDAAERFRNPSTLTQMNDTLTRLYEDDKAGWRHNLTTDRFTYAPITRDDFIYARYYIMDDDCDAELLAGNKGFNVGTKNKKSIESDLSVYAYSTLLENENVPEDVREFFTTITADLDNGGTTVIDALTDYYQN